MEIYLNLYHLPSQYVIQSSISGGHCIKHNELNFLSSPPEVTVEMDHVDFGIHQHPVDNNVENFGEEVADNKPLLH